MIFSSLRALLLVLLTSLAMLPVCSAAASIVLLDAHFDDKQPDQPIGTGGAALGEPIFVHGPLDAIVRKEPGSDDNQELELSAGPGTSALSARFEFLDSAEITDGVVQVRAEVILGTAESFRSAQFYVREQGSNAQSFASLQLIDSGVLRLTGAGIDTQVWSGLVRLEDRNQIELVFDMDEGRYWLWFNDNDLAPPEGYAHGITERGIGRVTVGLGAPTDDPRSARVDNLLVTWLPGDALFANGFEAMIE